MIGVGGTVDNLLSWLISAFPFIMCQWEEYYLGELNLGVVNAASEGVLVLSSLYFIRGVWGTEFSKEFFSTEVVEWNGWAYSRAQLTIRMFMFIFVIIHSMGVVRKVINQFVINDNGEKFHCRENNTESLRFIHCLIALSPFVVPLVLIGIWLNIPNSLGSGILSSLPRMLIYVIGINFAKEVEKSSANLSTS
jgi:hypothetical protein